MEITTQEKTKMDLLNGEIKKLDEQELFELIVTISCTNKLFIPLVFRKLEFKIMGIENTIEEINDFYSMDHPSEEIYFSVKKLLKEGLEDWNNINN